MNLPDELRRIIERLSAKYPDLIGKDAPLALASRMVRRTVVERARKAIAKQPGDAAAAEVLKLDRALVSIAEQSPRQALLLEMRFFAGATDEEAAAALGVSLRTVRRDWSLASIYMRAALDPERG